jgi:hypothetical protein
MPVPQTVRRRPRVFIMSWPWDLINLASVSPTFSRYLHDNKCLPPYTTDNCFLEDRTLMGRFPVLFDAAYGPFLKCNPTHIPDPASPTGYSPYLNMSDWLCAWGLPPPKNPWTPHRSWQTDCIPYDTNHTCPRLNVSVGKDPAEHEFYRRKDLLPTHFEGYWYTTPRRGRCGPNQSPSDGSGCTWTVTAEPSFINASCLVGRLFDVLEDYNPACFRNCTGGANRTDPCFRQCVTATVVATANTSGMPTAPMVAAWERAFVPGTGCPRVNVSTPTDYPPPSPATSPPVAVWS